MVAIIILNWNGYKDTIDCLHSLYQINYSDFFIIVGDNGSKDESLNHIAEWCSNNSIYFQWYKFGDAPPSSIEKREIILYDMKENHGFSRGNNLMIKFIATINPDFYFLLNNDTEVEPDFMSILMTFAIEHPDIKVLTPQIRYFYNKNLIWNCGGKIIWGLRKYHYCNLNKNSIREKEFIPCSFVTGCSLLFNESILLSDGSLFIEDYFFGEEDFELALRMKQHGYAMACVVPSIIYHKVGTSTKKTKSNKRSFIYYMNRFINVRHYMNSLSYILWVALYLPYIVLTCKREGNTIVDSISFARTLLSESIKYEGVSKEYFEKIWNTDEIIM